jgi:excisionase family DNA binding protein
MSGTVRDMSRKFYTTAEAAKAVKVSRPTIQYWISTGKIAAPELQIRGSTAVRLWTETDVEHMRKLSAALKSGPKKK